MSNAMNFVKIARELLFETLKKQVLSNIICAQIVKVVAIVVQLLLLLRGKVRSSNYKSFLAVT